MNSSKTCDRARWGRRGSGLLEGLLLLLCAIVSGCSSRGKTAEDLVPAGPADRIFVNGHVVVRADRDDRPTALAVKNGRVLYVGTDKNVWRTAGGGTEIIDLEGAVIVPGLVDAHAHMEGLGTALETLDLVGTTSPAEIATRVTAWSRTVPAGTWILGRGWDQNDWSEKAFPGREVLDLAAPDHPVLLTRIDGHAAWASTSALAAGRIDDGTPDPAGGKILRDANGRATGVLVDTAMGAVRRAIPAPDRETRKRRLVLAVKECLSRGLTEVHDAGVDTETLELYEELAGEGNLPFRIYAMVSARAPDLDAYLAAGPRLGAGNGKITIRSVKAYADGALGSRGAALLEDYSDDPGNRGLVITPEKELEELAVKCLKSGFQLCTHAIGDRGNRLVLDAYEKALLRYPDREARFRVEHAQILAPEDIPRFRRLGVLPSMQPTHCTSDMPWVPARLGEKRIEGAYAWRSLIDTGVVIPGGSDFPVERVSPFLSLHAAVSRQDPEGNPEGGFDPRTEKMSPREALLAHTLWAHRGAFQEGIRGTLEPGRDADLVVLDRDPVTEDPESVLATRVLVTVVAGEVVHRSEG
jgi:hypothetical protein